MNNKSIGIFDSGVGGLTVALEVTKQLPNEEIIYFGDNGRNPYGVRSKEEITDFSKQIIRFLLTHDVKAVVIACNTATIASLEEVVKEFKVPIFGVVGPGVESTINTTKNKKVGLIATESSVKSGSYQRLIKEEDNEIQIYAKACPLLVTIAEECLFDTEISYHAVKHYIDELIEEGIDTLVLGCTHFSLHRRNLERVLGERVKLVDPALKTVEGLKAFLEKNEELRNNNEDINHKFYVSGNTEKFKEILDCVLEGDFIAERIDIEKY